MMAKPKTFSDGELKWHALMDGGILIECQVTDPPSVSGRNIELYVPPEMVVHMMKLARYVAGKQRAKPMTSS